MRIVRKKERGEEELERAMLQRMANAVVDETHWLQVLASAETDWQREELERVVGPLLSFRRAAPCTTPDCDSSLPGVWQPVLVVSNALTPQDQSWVPIELRLCDSCKSDAEVEHFVTDAIWEQVLTSWPTHGPLPPARRRTVLQFDRIH